MELELYLAGTPWLDGGRWEYVSNVILIRIQSQSLP